mmetsp:Transcript_11533/g.48280  ORF Transcript_11533/g.48280 Transcript_11533/m.48280 type:complete len:239 (+) Transcript_11533:3678-4394(+)
MYSGVDARNGFVDGGSCCSRSASILASSPSARPAHAPHTPTASTTALLCSAGHAAIDAAAASTRPARLTGQNKPRSTHSLLAAPGTETFLPSGSVYVSSFNEAPPLASSRDGATAAVASLTASLSCSRRRRCSSPHRARSSAVTRECPASHLCAAGETRLPSTTGATSVTEYPTSTLTPVTLPTAYSAATGCSATYKPDTLKDSNIICVSRSRSALEVNTGSVIRHAPSSPFTHAHWR